MRRSRWFLATTLVIGLILGSIGNPIDSSVLANQRQNKQQSVTAFLSSIFQPMRRRGATRQGGVCLVAPGLGDGRGVWHDRPLFIWDREIGRIEVRPLNSDTVVWDQAVSPNSRSMVYQGQPLQPGQTYVVLMFDQAGSRFVKDEAMYPKFTQIEEQQQNVISQNLTTIETQLKNQGNTNETIALEQARYLTLRLLWSDALQVISSVQNPSLELQSFLQNTIAETCKT